MNKAILIGNLTKDPEKKATENGASVTSFTVAVRRRFKNANGTYDTDFINCVAWRGTADFVAQYFTKGKPISIVGSIQTRDYLNKQGQKVYVTEVNVEEAEFVQGAKAETKETPKQPTLDDFGFKEVSFNENELPF